jgi:uncharacterized protein YrrD
LPGLLAVRSSECKSFSIQGHGSQTTNKFMLRSIKQLYGNQLGASDGEIGHIKDFYFEDQTWMIRYLVVDTGLWLPGRQVLLSPHSLGRLDQAQKVLRVNLTRKQIENSPSIDSHKPVSRQYEEEYHRYYGWPVYWQEDGLLGGSDVSAKSPEDKSSARAGSQHEQADAHLRSTRAVNGYHLQTAEGVIGHICDFMMDAQSWAIGQLVVKTGHRFSGKEDLIPTKKVERISYDESTVFVDLTREATEQTPAPQIA